MILFLIIVAVITYLLWFFERILYKNCMDSLGQVRPDPSIQRIAKERLIEDAKKNFQYNSAGLKKELMTQEDVQLALLIDHISEKHI